MYVTNKIYLKATASAADPFLCGVWASGGHPNLLSDLMPCPARAPRRTMTPGIVEQFDALPRKSLTTSIQHASLCSSSASSSSSTSLFSLWCFRMLINGGIRTALKRFMLNAFAYAYVYVNVFVSAYAHIYSQVHVCCHPRMYVYLHLCMSLCFLCE